MEETKDQKADAEKQFERRTAQAMVAAYVEVARSVQFAHWLQQTRERSLERRAERSNEMKEILAIQQQIDAQQPQATILATASGHLRAQAANLANFAKAGLTLEDFERIGVGNVMDIEELKKALEARAGAPEAAAAAPGEAQTESAEPADAPERKA